MDQDRTSASLSTGHLYSGLAGEASEAIDKAITYLENQRAWIGSSKAWRKQGYPVGSGMIERAVTLVINRRMKKRGMRWKRVKGTAIVAVRTDLLNDDWTKAQRLRTFPLSSPGFWVEPISAHVTFRALST